MRPAIPVIDHAPKGPALVTAFASRWWTLTQMGHRAAAQEVRCSRVRPSCVVTLATGKVRYIHRALQVPPATERTDLVPAVYVLIVVVYYLLSRSCTTRKLH